LEGRDVLEVTNSRSSSEPVGNLAGEVLTDLYRAVFGDQPAAVRVYQEDDALLLLLRFEPDAIGNGDPSELSESILDTTFLDTTFLAMTSMIASAVEARSGRQLFPGNVSVCAARGLAVFAFSVIDEDADERTGEDLFRIDSPIFGVAPGGRPTLRLAS
jgi:hypothetical protein